MSATDRVYRSLRQAILVGDSPAGTWLREAQIATELNVSRTPVREALRLLGAEGLVEMDTHRGAQVKSWNDRDIDEIYSIRSDLEAYAAKLAALRANDEDVARLEANISEQLVLDEAEDSQAKVRAAELTFEFHRQILDISGNLHLASVVGALVERPVLHRAQLRYSPARLDRSRHEHELLVSAIAAGDEEWAEAIMRQHVLGARAEERRIFRDRAQRSASGEAG